MTHTEDCVDTAAYRACMSYVVDSYPSPEATRTGRDLLFEGLTPCTCEPDHNGKVFMNDNDNEPRACEACDEPITSYADFCSTHCYDTFTELHDSGFGNELLAEIVTAWTGFEDASPVWTRIADDKRTALRMVRLDDGGTGEQRDIMCSALLRSGWSRLGITDELIRRAAVADLQSTHYPAPVGRLCQWFALCVNPAVTTRPMPWGPVDCCGRCASWVDEQSGRAAR